MTDRHIERYLRERKRRTRSLEEQIDIAHAMWNHSIGPTHDGLKSSEIEDELGLNLNFEAKTSLKHLEDVDLVEEFVPPGPDTLVIAPWMDNGEGDVINGEVTEAAEEGLDALVDDLKDSSAGSGTRTAADGSGVTTRSVVAAEFDVVPDQVEEFLKTASDPVDVLNRAVEAIEETDGVEVGDGYDEILFINQAHRFRLTEQAVGLYER